MHSVHEWYVLAYTIVECGIVDVESKGIDLLIEEAVSMWVWRERERDGETERQRQ